MIHSSNPLPVACVRVSSIDWQLPEETLSFSRHEYFNPIGLEQSWS